MRKLLFLALLFPSLLSAQAWSGIISPSRAIDWSVEGLPATFPDGETTPNPWTPPTRTQQGPTLTTANTPAQINAAISACTAGHFILLATGTYNFGNNGLNVGSSSGCTVRGSGGDKTIITLTSGAGGGSVGFGGSSSTINTSWTAGFSQGTTSINIGSATGAIVGQSHIILNGSGSTVDPGIIWACSAPNFCSSEFGAGVQKQSVLVAGCDGITTVGHACVSGTGVTISPGIYASNYASLTKSVDVVQNEPWGNGLEDMTIDCGVNTSTGSGCFFGSNTYASWIKGCRILFGFNASVNIRFSKNWLIANNYFFGTPAPSVSIKQLIQDSDSSDLIINNIITNGLGLYLSSGNAGNVYAYNFDKNGSSLSQQDFLGNIQVRHETGEIYLLAEGNETGAIQDDDIHGPKGLNTFLRNLIYGNDPPYTKTHGIAALNFEGPTRFDNAVYNVLGSTATNLYQVAVPNGGNKTIYLIGGRQNGPWSAGNPEDFLSLPSTMRYGNFDVVTGSTRRCSPASANFANPPCSSVSEVPTTLKAVASFTQSLSGSGVGPYTATLANLPCVLGNELVVSSLGGTSFTGPDPFGNGNIPNFFHNNGSGGITTNNSSGTVNCTTGAVSITFTTTPDTTPTIQYLQQLNTASPFANVDPAGVTIPPSFFMPTTAHPSGGTGLSWWKTCTNYPTCNTFKIQPFPPIGDDVTGGDVSWNGINYGGRAYHIPAAIAWNTLPIDHSYQGTRAITGASWSAANGGTETYTVDATGFYGLIVGDFQVTGMSPAGCNASGNAFFEMTSSTTNTNYPGSSGGTLTVSFSMPANLGCSGAGSFLYPNIRVFNENIYQLDSAVVSSGPAAKISGNVVVKGSVKIQ